MAATRVLVDEPRAARLPGGDRRGRRARLIAARLAALAAVLLAALAGATLALATFAQHRTLSVGDVRLSVDPGHRGALDVYVPLVDWGGRFEAIALPARLRVDVRTVDRRTVREVATGRPVDVDAVLDEARDAIAGYLRALVLVVFAGALALGILTALAVRTRAGPPVALTAGLALAAALGSAAAVAVLLPPRGELSNPQYYAHGPDIPRALRALDDAQRSGQVLDQELDAQLVGLARLVTRPAERAPLDGRPSLTIASDLHNNLLALPILERAAAGGPVLFAGDLTDRGTSLETRLVERVVRAGRPFVFVSGNHDSDTLGRRLARRGAIVLTQRGRLHGDGSYGAPVARVRGVRVAGYGDPGERRSTDGYADRHRPRPTLGQRLAFATWLRSHAGRVDVVMVHQPALAEQAVAELRANPPDRPLVLAVGHTHEPALERVAPTVTIVNGGTVGAGGTGNLAEEGAIGIARLVFDTQDGFTPLAGDLVRIDPGTGSATARRERLDPP